MRLLGRKRTHDLEEILLFFNLIRLLYLQEIGLANLQVIFRSYVIQDLQTYQQIYVPRDP